MTELTASRLAEALQLSKGRISQLVAEGRLEGCYVGEGRARRFDLEKCAEALDRKLDPGQCLGNGAPSAEARREIVGAKGAGTVAGSTAGDDDAPLSNPDMQRYQRARADMAETRAQKDRLALAVEEGRYVLASEVELRMRRAISAEIGEIDGLLKTLATTIAAEHSLDARSVKSVMLAHWRAHRLRRAERAQNASLAADLTAEERDDERDVA